jgi:hypothetical protein|tara:strand:- start:439 stop:1218 length:780 start_codon:yes stop_codon:yes gene_type:complete
MKILHIIIYSESNINHNIKEGTYENMQKLLSNYYKKFNNNVLTYFVKYDNNIKNTHGTDYYIINDIIYINGEETFMPGILEKTLLAIKYLNISEYDYFIRSNVSTIIEFNRLISYLEINPIDYYGSGKLFNLQCSGWNGVKDSTLFGTLFASGTSIIFTKKAINDIFANMNLVRMEIIDDVSLGIFVKEYKKDVIPIEIDKNYFYEVPYFMKDSNSIDEFIKYIKNKDIIFYRNKCFGIYVKHRDIDYEQMKIIVNSIK